MSTRKIIHIDMDAFYASIEQRDDPSLRGVPLVVGHPRSERAVVAAASYEARRFGIHSAMPMVRAWHLCPHLIAVKPDFRKYRAASAQLRAILEEYTERIEPLSLDECYLDVTEDTKGIGSATWIAQELRTRVHDELGLTASAGVAPVKFVAKLASDHRKPDGLTVVEPRRVLEFIHPLPIEALWGVGPVTAQRLHAMRICRIRDLADADLERLVEVFGARGRRLHDFAHGRDEREVIAERPRKQRGLERTFTEDVEHADEVLTIAMAQLERLCQSLQRAGEKASCLTIKLRYADFSTITRSYSLACPAGHVAAFAPRLPDLLSRTEAGQRPVRLIGVSLSGLALPDEQGAQLELSLQRPRPEA